MRDVGEMGRRHSLVSEMSQVLKMDVCHAPGKHWLALLLSAGHGCDETVSFLSVRLRSGSGKRISALYLAVFYQPALCISHVPFSRRELPAGGRTDSAFVEN